MRGHSNDIRPTLGIVGFGAFGRLVAEHLAPWFQICAFDPAHKNSAYIGATIRVTTDVALAASCQFVVLAPPVEQLRTAIRAIRPHLQPGTIVLDVCSVKVEPVRMMDRELPAHVEVIGTHPLFGPQSAQNGIAGRKIVLCPIRTKRARRIAAFLRSALRLKVFFSTADAHDREMAIVQGLTHLIGKLLVQMEPLPTQMTTASYDLMMEAVAMVRDDNAALYRAIEFSNPFTAQIRERFFELVDKSRQE